MFFESIWRCIWRLSFERGFKKGKKREKEKTRRGFAARVKKKKEKKERNTRKREEKGNSPRGWGSCRLLQHLPILDHHVLDPRFPLSRSWFYAPSMLTRAPRKVSILSWTLGNLYRAAVPLPLSRFQRHFLSIACLSSPRTCKPWTSEYNRTTIMDPPPHFWCFFSRSTIVFWIRSFEYRALLRARHAERFLGTFTLKSEQSSILRYHTRLLPLSRYRIWYFSTSIDYRVLQISRRFPQ